MTGMTVQFWVSWGAFLQSEQFSTRLKLMHGHSLAILLGILWKSRVVEIEVLKPASRLSSKGVHQPTMTSDPWHQQGIFLHNDDFSSSSSFFKKPFSVRSKDGFDIVNIQVDKVCEILRPARPALTAMFTTNKVTLILFLHHSDPHFKLKEVVFAMSTCLNPVSWCYVTGWVVVCLGKQLNRATRYRAGRLFWGWRTPLAALMKLSNSIKNHLNQKKKIIHELLFKRDDIYIYVCMCIFIHIYMYVYIYNFIIFTYFDLLHHNLNFFHIETNLSSSCKRIIL